MQRTAADALTGKGINMTPNEFALLLELLGQEYIDQDDITAWCDCCHNSFAIHMVAEAPANERALGQFVWCDGCLYENTALRAAGFDTEQLAALIKAHDQVFQTLAVCCGECGDFQPADRIDKALVHYFSPGPVKFYCVECTTTRRQT